MKGCDVFAKSTAHASPAEPPHELELGAAPPLDHIMAGHPLKSFGVMDGVTIGAQDLALRGLRDHPSPRAVELRDPELLPGRIAMVEVERSAAPVVSAAAAASAEQFQQPDLERSPALALVADPGRGAPLASAGCSRSGVGTPDRITGRVVLAERRAGETEAPVAQPARLAVDQSTRAEGFAALRADLHKGYLGARLTLACQRRCGSCSPGRTRTSDLAVTRSPRFPSDVDYLIALARRRAVGTGRLVSEPSRSTSLRAWLRIALALTHCRFPAVHPVIHFRVSAEGCRLHLQPLALPLSYRGSRMQVYPYRDRVRVPRWMKPWSSR
jgi:hypothetical protein